MGRIFKNLIPYWKMVVLIILLLILQAACDLALPQYTSDIIDTGILNNGVEHILPEAVISEEFECAKLFMTNEELELWDECYDLDGDIYYRNVSDRERLEELDDIFSEALVLSYQMSMVDEVSFKSQLAAWLNIDEASVNDMSLADIGEMTGTEIKYSIEEKEDSDGNISQVTYVDMRAFFKDITDLHLISADSIHAVRNAAGDYLKDAGSSIVSSIGAAYAVRCDKEAGLDITSIQNRYLLIAGLKMLGVTLIMALATILVGFFSAKTGAGIGRDLRGSLFNKVVSFSNSEMDKFSTASLITRSTNDVQQIQMVSIMMLRMIVYAPIIGIGGVIKVINSGTGMGWIIVLAVLVIMGLIFTLMAIAMPKFKLMQKLVDRVNLVSREILTGLSVIRAFRREEREEERFDEANTALTKTTLFTNRVMTFMSPCMMLIMNGLSVLIVWVAAGKIEEGTLQVGAMTAFITYAMQIVMSFLMLTVMSIMLPRAAVAANRIDEVLSTEPSIKNAPDPEQVTECDGVVAFNHVNFRYPGAKEDVLEDIDFVAEPGKTTAIIGSTGSGKSTLVNLIPRLYDVSGGNITLDGRDIKDISIEALRAQIGYVPQKAVLFSGTIASNLRFGKEDADDEELKAAVRIAQAEEFIEEKEYKYESHIAQGGANVSGGQKQRLSIARAIAKRPKIFIFDDSFSALDLKTDAALRKALDKEVNDSTVIIVAQRVSTILNADQIIVLDDGKIAGKGTHDYLIRSCGVYQQIAKSQMSEKELGLDKEVSVDE